MDLEIDVQERDGAVFVSLEGELDLLGAEPVDREILRAEEDRPALLVLDLRRLSFIDSSGLQLIISADNRAREQGHRLAIIQGPERVRRVFRLARLEEDLEIVEDPAEL